MPRCNKDLYCVVQTKASSILHFVGPLKLVDHFAQCWRPMSACVRDAINQKAGACVSSNNLEILDIPCLVGVGFTRETTCPTNVLISLPVDRISCVIKYLLGYLGTVPGLGTAYLAGSGSRGPHLESVWFWYVHTFGKPRPRSEPGTRVSTHHSRTYNYTYIHGIPPANTPTKYSIHSQLRYLRGTEQTFSSPSQGAQSGYV